VLSGSAGSGDFVTLIFVIVIVVGVPDFFFHLFEGGVLLETLNIGGDVGFFLFDFLLFDRARRGEGHCFGGKLFFFNRRAIFFLMLFLFDYGIGMFKRPCAHRRGLAVPFG